MGKKKRCVLFNLYCSGNNPYYYEIIDIKREEKIIFNEDETIEVRNILGKIKKQESFTMLQDIRKRHLAMDKASRIFYCLIFDYQIVNDDLRNYFLLRKIPHVIAIAATKHNTEILRKHLPEKWQPYLDQPVEK